VRDDGVIRLGISACLLGHEVRYDGGHKRDSFLVDTFGKFVEWVPVCPEVEVGMGTPREPVHLVRGERGIRLLTVDTRIDYTDAMNGWAERRLDDLARQNISGYVLKKNSPSCGKAGVRVFAPDAPPSREGRGVFADALLRRFPGLPVQEEDELHDPLALQSFLDRVIQYQRTRHAPD
jgi:uncharacterized protein YbbK (DUF523 family)